MLETSHEFWCDVFDVVMVASRDIGNIVSYYTDISSTGHKVFRIFHKKQKKYEQKLIFYELNNYV